MISLSLFFNLVLLSNIPDYKTFDFYKVAPHLKYSNMERGYATTYWPGDGHCGDIRADGKPFTLENRHIAHRTLPLGTKVIICNIQNGLCVKTYVKDRGPYGFCNSKDRKQPHCRPKPPPYLRGKCINGIYNWKVIVRKKDKCGYYRGIVDMSTYVAKRIKANGFQSIILFY